MPLCGEPAQPLARAYCVVVPTVPTLPVLPVVAVALRRLAAALYRLCEGGKRVLREEGASEQARDRGRTHAREG